MTYNPEEVEYSKLVDLFYSRHNSTTPNRSGNDVGTQYRSGIYYQTEDQKQVLQLSPLCSLAFIVIYLLCAFSLFHFCFTPLHVLCFCTVVCGVHASISQTVLPVL